MMKPPVWIRLLAVTTLVVAGCATGNTPATGNAASAARTTSSTSPTTPAASPSPVPIPPLRLALVTLRGSDAYVVRDLTDISHPRTIGNLGTIAAPQFVSATEV